jgi:hypothetical protein
MYHLFRRFEWLAFGVVTASAVACAGFMVVQHLGGIPAMQDLPVPHGRDGAVNYALACGDISASVFCEQLLAAGKVEK